MAIDVLMPHLEPIVLGAALLLFYLQSIFLTLITIITFLLSLMISLGIYFFWFCFRDFPLLNFYSTFVVFLC